MKIIIPVPFPARPEDACEPAADDALWAPVRPRYYAEQPISAADLNAAVPWADARLCLNRFRAGWGVVFGLSVRAGVGKDKFPALSVDTGYAVGGRGEDIVVAKRGEKSLKGFCGGTAPCDGFGVAPAEQEKIEFGTLLAVPEDELAAFDLVLEQELKGCDPRTAPACRPLTPAHTEHARETESFVLRLVKPDDSLELAHKPAGKELVEDFANLKQPPTEAALSAWFTKEGVNLARLAYLYRDEKRGAIPECRAKQTVLQNWPELLALLLIDRISEGAAPPSPVTEPGVRLARVWVRSGHKTACEIVAVDQTPAYRRPFGPDLPAGATDLRPYLGSELKNARKELTAAGQRLKEIGAQTELPVATTGATAFRDSLFGTPTGDTVWYALHGQPFTPVVFDCADFGTRILGFRRGAVTAVTTNTGGAGDNGANGEDDTTDDTENPPDDNGTEDSGTNAGAGGGDAPVVPPTDEAQPAAQAPGEGQT